MELLFELLDFVEASVDFEVKPLHDPIDLQVAASYHALSFPTIPLCRTTRCDR
jgi:hypothetical protein